MTFEEPENEPSRHQWLGFWSMIVQQTQNAFNDKMAQFTLIPLAGVVATGFAVESWAGLMIALPFVLFAPVAGWLSDRFSKRSVMLGAAIAQVLILGWICGAVWLRSLPLALAGFFALAVQSAFYSPAKIGSNKELVGSKHLGFASGIQQMTSMLAILAGQIVAGWLFDQRFSGQGGGDEVAWQAAYTPLMILAVCSVPALALALLVPRVPAQGSVRFTGSLVFNHFTHLSELWRERALRRASLGVAFFWGFAAFINLWSVKVAKSLTGGGEGFGTLSSEFMAAASLGMAVGFGFASMLLRKRIELGWVPLAGFAMMVVALTLAFLTPGGWFFLITLALLAFCAAVFLAPLNAWLQDNYPADKRGEMQAAVNLQDCFAGMIAVAMIAVFEITTRQLGLTPAMDFALQMGSVGLMCGAMSLYFLRSSPADVIRLVGVALLRVVYRIRVSHPERLPKKGGVLLLPNHVTFADAFFISAACHRPVRFVMDEAFMASPWIRGFVSVFDTLTIRRDAPLDAIRSMITGLKNGDVICLFPEGQLTRTGTLSELRRGFELTAKKAGVPLIPLWCDGSWGSIFSFERGRFREKFPYRIPYSLSLAFGEPIAAASVTEVRDGLLEASAAALAKRFPQGDRAEINGHQLGQVNALQRKASIFTLEGDLELLGISESLSAFSQFFGASLLTQPTPGPGVWVGGATLRDSIQPLKPGETGVFYDFSAHALVPFQCDGWLHLPCLAVEGMVIAMSMPDPPKNQVTDEAQRGNQPGTWGKLLPGWYLKESRVHGPAAPENGLELPCNADLDPEGFLTPDNRPHSSL